MGGGGGLKGFLKSRLGKRCWICCKVENTAKNQQNILQNKERQNTNYSESEFVLPSIDATREQLSWFGENMKIKTIIYGRVEQHPGFFMKDPAPLGLTGLYRVSRQMTMLRPLSLQLLESEESSKVWLFQSKQDYLGSSFFNFKNCKRVKKIEYSTSPYSRPLVSYFHGRKNLLGLSGIGQQGEFCVLLY